MQRLPAAIVILGICLVIAAFLIGGRYQVVAGQTGQVGGGTVYVVDKFTGDTTLCYATGCRIFLPELPLITPDKPLGSGQ